MGHMMNNRAYRYIAALGLGLLLGEAHAEYWTVDELVKEFNQVSAQISQGDLQAAEAKLEALRQRAPGNDVRLGQYQRELANAYLQRSRQQLQAGDTAAASATLAKGERHLGAASPALKQQYSQAASVASPAPQVAAKAQPAQPKASESADAEARRQETERRLREAEAALARKEAERVRQQQLAEEKAAAEREARAQQAAAKRPEPVAPPPPVVAAKVAEPVAPRAQLIDPAAPSSTVPLPMLDAGDREALRDLLDRVAADVVAFGCAVSLEVREAKDYPFVAALLSARIKKLDPGFAPRLSPVYKPDQEPRLVLSPQRNG